jgi:hypothetical protein
VRHIEQVKLDNGLDDEGLREAVANIVYKIQCGMWRWEGGRGRGKRRVWNQIGTVASWSCREDCQVEEGRGMWKKVEDGGGRWRKVEEGGRRWKKVEEGGRRSKKEEEGGGTRKKVKEGGRKWKGMLLNGGG